MGSFQNKVVWITGASSGIGEELAYAFAKEGARLVLSSRNRQKLEKVRENCGDRADSCLLLPLDLSDQGDFLPIAEEVVEKMGGVDILINNAGRSQRSLAEETPVKIDRQIMELNFFGAIKLTKAVLPSMIERKTGHLVIISSITGKFGFPLRTAYSASKHALQGYFEALRFELEKYHIKVTIVSPGRVKTNISLNALTHTGDAHQKMDDGQAQGMAADVCAQKIIRAIKTNRKEVLIGNREINLVHIRRFFPRLFYRIVSGLKKW